MKRTALVTGASSGLGLEFSNILASNGYDLVVVARNEGRLFSLKKELEEKYPIHVYVCAQDLSLVDAALDVYDYVLENKIIVDVLINNAGFGDFGDFVECDWKKQYEMVQVDIVALMQLTRCFLKPMIERGHGKIVNLSSIASFCAGPRMSIYYASKEFVRSFSEAVAEEVKGTGVTVTALCPGPTSTGFEKTAEMKNSKMFVAIKPATAKDVAEAGYKSLKKGKPLVYYGFPTKAFNILTRIVPRSISRKIAMKING